MCNPTLTWIYDWLTHGASRLYVTSSRAYCQLNEHLVWPQPAISWCAVHSNLLAWPSYRVRGGDAWGSVRRGEEQQGSGSRSTPDGSWQGHHCAICRVYSISPWCDLFVPEARQHKQEKKVLKGEFFLSRESFTIPNTERLQLKLTPLDGL